MSDEPERGARRLKTHCKLGHPFAGDNLYVRPSNSQRYCRACGHLYAHRWWNKYPERTRKRSLAAAKRYATRLRFSVLSHYCGGTPHCQCPGCSVTFIDFLQLDHIAGDGSEHRKKNKITSTGYHFWLWIKKNNYPIGFQALCANCNSAKRNSHACPLGGKQH